MSGLRHRAIVTLLGVLAAVGIWAPSASASTSTVSVPAAGTGGSIYFTDSGVFIPAGKSVTISASGTWSVCTFSFQCSSGPDGGPFFNPYYDVPGSPAGTLVGSLDNGATWSAIGAGPTVVNGPGELLLAANDIPPTNVAATAADCPNSGPAGCYADNSGSVSAVITPGASARSVTVTFASGPAWSVFSQDPGPAANGQGNGLGFAGSAQAVCPNQSYPPSCPANAVIYGFPGPAWLADLSAIPGAVWSWAPGITGSSGPAELAKFYFAKGFVLTGHPTAGSVYLAADDFAELRVNGRVVGSIGSITDVGLAGQAQSYLTRFDVSAFLKPGYSYITIVGQNGPPSFSGVCGTICTYSENPAGVVFGGSLTFMQGS